LILNKNKDYCQKWQNDLKYLKRACDEAIYQFQCCEDLTFQVPDWFRYNEISKKRMEYYGGVCPSWTNNIWWIHIFRSTHRIL